MTRRRHLQSAHRRPCSAAGTTSSGITTRLRGCAIIMAVTHEQSLRACAAYRALASDGRFRRLWMVAALRVAGLKGLKPYTIRLFRSSRARRKNASWAQGLSLIMKLSPGDSATNCTPSAPSAPQGPPTVRYWTTDPPCSTTVVLRGGQQNHESLDPRSVPRRRRPSLHAASLHPAPLALGAWARSGRGAQTSCATCADPLR